MIIPERALNGKMFSFFSQFSQGNIKRIFLDYASTTPTDPEVISAMREAENFFANPSALYKEGVEAKHFLEESREMVADVLGCKSREVIFTGTGTESCNLALRGLVHEPKESHIVTTAIEHPAVLESCKKLEEEGAKVDYVKVDESGVVSVQDVLDAIRPETRIVSVMYVNNETGAIQPIRNIGTKIDKINQDRKRPIYFHSDASQAPCYLNVKPEALKADALTLDGSKIYGPKGVGVLFSRSSFKLKPIICGGGQEFGLRSGTENNIGARGMAVALRVASEMVFSESKRVGVLKKDLLDGIMSKIPKASVNGDIKKSSPHILNICIPDSDGEFLVARMDSLGVSCSSSSSCKARHKGSSSHVLKAMGKNECATSSLRFSLGRKTSSEEISLVPDVLYRAINF